MNAASKDSTAATENDLAAKKKAAAEARLETEALYDEFQALTLALEKAAYHGDVASIITIIEKSTSAEFIAKHKRKFSIDESLFNRGSPLLRAAACGHFEAVKVLLHYGANPLHECNKTTPYHAAVKTGDLAIVNLLSTAGANPEAYDITGNATLHIAAQAGHAHLIPSLIEANLDLQIKHESEVIKLLQENIARAIKSSDEEPAEKPLLAQALGLIKSIRDTLLLNPICTHERLPLSAVADSDSCAQASIDTSLRSDLPSRIINNIQIQRGNIILALQEMITNVDTYLGSEVSSPVIYSYKPSWFEGITEACNTLVYAISANDERLANPESFIDEIVESPSISGRTPKAMATTQTVRDALSRMSTPRKSESTTSLSPLK